MLILSDKQVGEIFFSFLGFHILDLEHSKVSRGLVKKKL